MSIMVDWEIRQAIESGHLLVEPYSEKNLQPNSLDVTLGSSFTINRSRDVVDPFDSESVLNGIQYMTMDEYVIEPKEFVLAATVEKFTLPPDIVGQLTGKSSLARLGLIVHVTAGFIDAGFSTPPATITLELFNCSKRAIVLTPGMPIGQMVFTKTAVCEVPYNQKKSAKYLGQRAAAPSQYFLNRILDGESPDPTMDLDT